MIMCRFPSLRLYIGLFFPPLFAVFDVTMCCFPPFSSVLLVVDVFAQDERTDLSWHSPTGGRSIWQS